jgi:hypothetical protein
LDARNYGPAIHLECIGDIVPENAKQHLDKPIRQPAQGQFQAGIIHHAAAAAEARPEGAIINPP